ncbi:TPA: YadA-like family protein [Escherichia coli]|nr:YadA-like family protein [Escherichia coli]HBI2839951.1 YadA-like family protein [Escherichia coli]
MSKNFTKTLLAGAVLGAVFAGAVHADNEESLLGFSLYKGDIDNQSSSQYLSSEKYRILWNKDSGFGMIYYGSSPDISANKNKALYFFDSKGNVYTTLNDGSQLKVFNKDVADFARSVADGKYSTVTDVHNMNELEVRQLVQQIDSIKTTFADVNARVNENISNINAIAKDNNEKISKINSVLNNNENHESLSVGSSAVTGNAVHATALGVGADARAKLSTAVGAHSTAYQQQSTAVGVGSRALAQNSVTVGTGAGVELNATNGVALGMLANAKHQNSVALGTQSVTTRDDEVNIGYKNSKGEGTCYLGGLRDGEEDTDAATVGQLNRKTNEIYEGVKGALTAADIKSRSYTDQKTSEVSAVVSELSVRTNNINEAVVETSAKVDVGVNSDGGLTRAEGASKVIGVNEGLLALSGRTDKIDAAVGAVDKRVSSNTQAVQKNSKAIAANTRMLQQHSARLDSQQRQINENHKEMKRAAAQSAALTGLFQPYSVGKFNATAAVGGYSDQQALAVGVGYRFNEQTAAKAGVAFSDGDASWNVGVNFEF